MLYLFISFQLIESEYLLYIFYFDILNPINNQKFEQTHHNIFHFNQQS